MFNNRRFNDNESLGNNPYPSRSFLYVFRSCGWIYKSIFINPLLSIPNCTGYIQKRSHFILPLPEYCFWYQDKYWLISLKCHKLSCHRKLKSFSETDATCKYKSRSVGTTMCIKGKLNEIFLVFGKPNLFPVNG